jgi:hypothetical protein
MKAVNDSTYLDLVNNKEREKYAITIRRNLIKKLPNYISIVRQEMYNYTDKEINKEISNPKSYFNSFLLYRLLEEFYDINLYVILHKENLQSDEPGIEIPNHSMLHIRPYNPNRKTVVVIKHTGGEMEGLKEPQYDLIFDTGILIDKEEKKLAQYDRKFIFDNDMNKLLYSILYKYNENIIFNINNNDKIDVRKLPYSQLNWEIIFKDFIFESQNIDIYGKVISFNLQVPKTDINFTVYVPPTQPLNLPNKETLYKTTQKIVESIFGEPYDENKDGLWYNVLDFNYGVFIHCDTKSNKNIPLSPIMDKPTENNSISLFRNVKKYSKMLIDCIIWGLRSNGVLNFEDYMNKYDKFIIVDESVKHNIPPFKNISFISESGNFTNLSVIWPEYFTNNNTVRLYPELYDKIVKYLAIYYKNNDGLSLAPEPYLTNIFKYEWDFTPFDQNRILIGENHLEKWLINKELNFNGEMQIYTKLNTELLNNNSDIPIIYDFNGKHYLIQNVKDGNFNRALNCGNEWNINKINIGYDSSPAKNNDIPYIILNISNSFDLFIEKTEDDKRDGDVYVTILKVDDVYKAMLEL